MSGALGFLSADAGTGRAWRRPSRDEVRTRVTPVLLDVLDHADPQMVDSALIALGRSTHPDDAGPVLQAMSAHWKSPYVTVRQAALLGAGMIGDRSSVPVLWSVMNDTAAGRTALGRRSAITGLDRPLASLSLGFAAGAEMIPQLTRLFERAESDEVNVLACAILSLGLIEGADQEVISFLAEALDDRKLDRRVRAQIPITLGRLSEDRRRDGRAAARAHLGAADTSGAASLVDHRAVGEIAAPSDTEAIAALRKTVRKSSDATARHFALIALGRIAARGLADQSPHIDAVRDIQRQLQVELVDPSHKVDLAVVRAGARRARPRAAAAAPPITPSSAPRSPRCSRRRATRRKKARSRSPSACSRRPHPRR